MPVILLIFGFALLIKGADWLVDGASSLAKRLGIPALVIGLTVVAFGTSAPELVVNVVASLGGNADIAIGNVIGSNIANILLILGVAAVIRPLAISHGTVWKEIPFSILAAAVVWVAVNDFLIDGRTFSELSRSDGLILLSFFVIFLYYIFSLSRKGERIRMDGEKTPADRSLAIAIGMTVGGLVGLVVGGQWAVGGASVLARHFGVSESVIGLTVVA
ncbi:sodium:calcium antiporter, partial [Candidatus Uhrbacteria bacterium]|nr:sodium:calcium antiporter [Candidatus Uhrbacteria bacterium]